VNIKKYGHDRYGRILGVVSFGGKNIDLEMVQAGLAEAYRGDPAPTSTSRTFKKAPKAKDKSQEQKELF
jgi:endonuclease YncB( thermonuclease family)